jgi:hypothetical protein
LDFVTALLRELPANVHIAFLGRGYEGAQKHTTAAGVADRLHLLAARPPSEVSAFIATADLGLLLYRVVSRNYHSALPNGFFHIIDAGLPLARLALPEVESLIGEAYVGPVLDASDASQAARTIVDFLASPGLAEAKAAASALGHSMAWEKQEHILRAVVDPV